ncbi:MAG: ATP-dependent DNA ligase, partial [Planctomycetia bacterium]
MERFTRLYVELDETNRTSGKAAALERYFRETPPASAAWALVFLTGGKASRVVSTKSLRAWAAEEACLSPWLVDECYHAVGDLAETLALLLSSTARPTDPEALPTLDRLVEDRLLPLKNLPEDERRGAVVGLWRRMNDPQRLVWNKLLTGSFRVGVARTLVVRALAAAADVPPAVMAHRLMGRWNPTPEDFSRLLSGDGAAVDPGRPYPFFLAHPLDGSAAALGVPRDWQAEYKWDGVRAQVIRRDGQTMIWSRGEELVTETFPEVAAVAAGLPDGTVLDGEILAWRGDSPMPFAVLQRRLGRKKVSAAVRRDAPVTLMAYDLLELDGVDRRDEPLSERRQRLQDLLQARLDAPAVRLSPLLPFDDWPQLEEHWRQARAERVEGLMLKRKAGPYRVGRVRGDWWKWKSEPYTVDAVMVYAQAGHGRRATLFTDYTFAVWSDGELVPVAKAYSGLTNAEILEVDAFVRRNTTEKFGPVRVVKPELVFELAFEGIQPSTRHKAGLALRFP